MPFRAARLLAAGLVAAGLFATLATGWPATAEEAPFIVVQSTTSTRNSGLYDHILPLFERATGIEVRVVAVGTGQAIGNASRGDGDVLIVHAREAEEAFVAAGLGVERFDLMHNDFVIVGPAADPAAIAGMEDAPAALARIAAIASHGAVRGRVAIAPFASRGDESGTHLKELALWRAAGIDPQAASGSWYLETGSGMGATLNTAAGLGAYALTDRATWVAFRNKGDLVLHVEGDDALFNQYGVILVNPEVFPHVKAAAGQAFIDWLLSPQGQTAIASYWVDGQQLFFPDAR